MRKNILRASSITLESDVARIRQSYKRAQQHNPPAAALIDQCDDLHVRRIAYSFAENVVRLKSCGASAPAESATCADGVENLRWSVVEGKECAAFSRYYLTQAMNTGQVAKVRAEYVRRAVMVAQGHDQEVADSVDFISDGLLIRIGEKVYREQGVANLEQRAPAVGNPFVAQSCPGLKLIARYE
jgi:hypothetical protein